MTDLGDPSAPTGTSVIRGAAVGLVAGLVASFAMDRFQAAVTARSSSGGDAEPATDKAAARITRTLTGHELAASAKPLGGQIVHYALGAGLGALYGVAAQDRRDVNLGHGAAFGIGVAALLDNIAVPAAGLGDPPWQTSAETHAYSLASHLVFGTVTEWARVSLETAIEKIRRS